MGRGGKKTYSSLEDTLVAPVRLAGLAHLILRRVRIHNPILPCNLLLVPLLVPLLLPPILLQLVRKLRLQIADLAVLGRVAARARGVRLQVLDLVLDLRVERLRLRDQVLDLLRGGAVWGGDGALVGGGYGAYLAREGGDLLAHAVDAGEEVGVAEDCGCGRLRVPALGIASGHGVLWGGAGLRVVGCLGVI